MGRVILMIALSMTIAFSFLFGNMAQAADDKDSHETRIFAGSTLVGAWKKSDGGKDFKDNDIKKAFDPDKVDAVLLRITSRDDKVVEIVVESNFNGSSKVFLVKTLPATHADVVLIMKLLGS